MAPSASASVVDARVWVYCGGSPTSRPVECRRRSAVRPEIACACRSADRFVSRAVRPPSCVLAFRRRSACRRRSSSCAAGLQINLGPLRLDAASSARSAATSATTKSIPCGVPKPRFGLQISMIQVCERGFGTPQAPGWSCARPVSSCGSRPLSRYTKSCGEGSLLNASSLLRVGTLSL